MASTTSNRRRAALWTVGRGTRGLLRFSDADTEFIAAGTALAGDRNRIHVLSIDREEDALTPVGVFAVPSEVWSHELINVSADGVSIIVATRHETRSALEVWSLPKSDGWHPRPATPPYGATAERHVPAVSKRSSLDVNGQVLKVCQNPFTDSMFLSMTDSDASVANVSDSLQLDTALEVSPETLSGSDGALVDGGWISANRAYVASEKEIALCDARTGGAEAVLKPAAAVKASKPETAALWVPPYAARIASACSGGGDVLYTGFEDGCLRAFDLRAMGMVWQVPRAHSQWVSALCAMQDGAPLSGGMDGVVRCWKRDGTSLATFPQHDDTVTNARCANGSFVTVSYDGRIALNEVGVGA